MYGYVHMDLWKEKAQNNKKLENGKYKHNLFAF